jgi:hypothetical protein
MEQGILEYVTAFGEDTFAGKGDVHHWDYVSDEHEDPYHHKRCLVLLGKLNGDMGTGERGHKGLRPRAVRWLRLFSSVTTISRSLSQQSTSKYTDFDHGRERRRIVPGMQQPRWN